MRTDLVISRRQFGRTIAAVLGGIAGIPRLAPAALRADLRVQFGFSLYGMKSLPLTQALKLCAEIGYDSIELACMEDWPTAPEKLGTQARLELRQQLLDRGLALGSLMENVSPLGPEKSFQDHLERLKRAAELARDLVPQHPPLIETVLGGAPGSWEQVRGQMVDRLGSWAELARATGIVIALKPHVSGALHTPDGALWLMQQLQRPELKLAFDYSHFELRGFPLASCLEQLHPHIAFIHVKDTHGDANKFAFLLPGDGRTDYAAYFQQLQRLKYVGSIMVEVSGQIHSRPDYDPEQAARLSYRKLAGILEDSGLRS